MTVTGRDLSPVFSPGISSPVVSLTFVPVGSPTIQKIQVDRTGTASDLDVPIAKLFRDLNQNDIVDDGDVLLDSLHFNSGSLIFYVLDYSPSNSENLLLVFTIASSANTSNTAGANIEAGYITGGLNTIVTFLGISTSNQPLPVQLYSLSGKVVNKNDLELNWITATQVNTYKFEVERKFTSDGQTDWQKIGEIPAEGNSNSPKSFSYVDKDLKPAKYEYRLKIVDLDGSFVYSNSLTAEISIPENFKLEQNYPNPFNPSTKISYSLPETGNITLKIYDIIGRELYTLINEKEEAGFHTKNFDASYLSSGVYIYTLFYSVAKSGKKFILSKKMLLVK